MLEGYVDPGERRREGPFGDHTGLLFAARRLSRSSISPASRGGRRPTYLTTVVGVPPMEDYYLGMASERIFLPLIQKTHPEIVDMHFPAEGIFHNLVIISIDKRYPGHARKIMSAFWGLGQLMFSKTVVIVDKDVNVHDLREVAWIVGTHMDPLARRADDARGRSTIWTMPAICRRTAERWASMRRGNGRRRATRAPGRRGCAPLRPPAAAPLKFSVNCRRSVPSRCLRYSGGMWRVACVMIAATSVARPVARRKILHAPRCARG